MLQGQGGRDPARALDLAAQGGRKLDGMASFRQGAGKCVYNRSSLELHGKDLDDAAKSRDSQHVSPDQHIGRKTVAVLTVPVFCSNAQRGDR